MKREDSTFVGIDMSKKKMAVTRMNQNGKVIKRRSFKTHSAGRESLIAWLKDTDIVGLESGNMSFLLAKQVMKESGNSVLVLHPGSLAMIYRSLKKTDKEDAQKLAHLLCRFEIDELPSVRIPDDKEEAKRRLSSEHKTLKEDRTRYINRFHNVFLNAGFSYVTKKDLNHKKRRWDLIEELPDPYNEEAERVLKMIISVDVLINEVEQKINEVLRDNEAVTKLLMSMPGIGPITTLAIQAYIGDGKQFKTAKQLTNYAGLVPRVDQSGDTTIYGKTIRGCTPLKRAMIQAAWSLIRSSYAGPLRDIYLKLKEKKGAGTAIVAIARRMLVIIHKMQQTSKSYWHITEDALEKKLKLYAII